MEKADKKEKLHQHHEQTLWMYWCLMILGVWLILSPITFDYAANISIPSGGRIIWLEVSKRISAMQISDFISGALLIVFSWFGLNPKKAVSLWFCCAIGIWLNIAPVLFWSPSALAYYNDTIVGTFAIALSILTPGMPNMMMYMKEGNEIPEGWSYNPSSWAQRWSMMVLGFAGWMVSRYLAAYQLGYIHHVADPFFGISSEHVLNSSISQSLPVSDASLGTLAYTFEFLMGWMGGISRWRTMPWMICFFGILVIPLGLVHIFLVISQPIAVGYWCSFCLLAAMIMLPMIPLEIDEVMAMIQHIIISKKNGEKTWTVFWKGGKPQTNEKDKRTPHMVHFHEQPAPLAKAAFWGMNASWMLLLSAIIGVVLVLLPAWFHIPIQSKTADYNHLLGSLIVVISVISMAEIIRSFRFLNILSGIAIVILCWYDRTNLLFTALDCVLGIAVIFLSVKKGEIKEQYGIWNKYIH